MALDWRLTRKTTSAELEEKSTIPSRLLKVKVDRVARKLCTILLLLVLPPRLSMKAARLNLSKGPPLRWFSIDYLLGTVLSKRLVPQPHRGQYFIHLNSPTVDSITATVH